MFPKKYAPVLFGLVLSGVMSLLVSGVSTYRVVGLTEAFVSLWAHAWIAAWLLAFPVALVVAPVARRVVELLIRKQDTCSTCQ
jgi:hypothetical protein